MVGEGLETVGNICRIAVFFFFCFGTNSAGRKHHTIHNRVKRVTTNVVGSSYRISGGLKNISGWRFRLEDDAC